MTTPRRNWSAAKGSELAEYLRQIREIPLLTPEEERELIVRSRRDGCERSRERLVLGNLRLAVYIAKRYAGLGAPLQDLVEAANVGLLLAVDRFDPGKEARFATYAQWWIRRSIFKTLADHGCMIQVPADARRAARACRDAVERLQSRLGRAVTPEELVAETGQAVPPSSPFTVGLPEGTLDDGRAMELPDPDAVPGDDRAAQRELAGRLRECLPSLPGHEGEIIRHHFGIEGEEPLTTRDIARELRLSERQVQHLLKSALARLAVMLSPDRTPSMRTTRLVP
jgi:RNA polymerase sigma factor (sigma-70 family)